ncbi:MAG: zinc ABC transporter substrate-binding protein [Candidatus Omnitrophica bacterium]|nr:zinc ABC transporter substrate-binding protein [Candidatus Omnitrophota bacterium]MBU4479811.1 zinc ABC transporter substrate-binding protein [Candidatus Omnitrophota bacterium]MCG2704413.1 zinc ABC transporter substrate-binding protein [Candidatus Omnitrophota bacterium]
MLKKTLLILQIFFLSISVSWAREAGGRVEVVTTLFPIYDFTKQVGKDKVNVSLLLPPGVEAHTFEPKPADIVRINKADIFIYTGRYMEPWVEGILKGVFNKNFAVIDASKGIELAGGEDDEDAAGAKEAEHHHHHGGKDPHIWLDLGNAQMMVDTIAAALAQKDPGNRGFYLNNAKEYKVKLAGLDSRFKSTLSTVKHKTLIHAGHFTFGYFARRYGLGYVSPYEGFSPNAEPTPRAIARLIDMLRQSGMRYVYHEELLDPKVGRTISQETGAKLELLHGAHNVSKDELNRGVTFLEIMEENLKKLKTGLECSPR